MNGNQGRYTSSLQTMFSNKNLSIVAFLRRFVHCDGPFQGSSSSILLTLKANVLTTSYTLSHLWKYGFDLGVDPTRNHRISRTSLAVVQAGAALQLSTPAPLFRLPRSSVFRELAHFYFQVLKDSWADGLLLAGSINYQFPQCQ
ncbi:hypothetical protein LWI29_034961 [Acer saccharum]|uniref:Uncharacterized protein n=1 Tax=Acer saccharum TaxID=4024 RepID=A0AA39S1K5_ACESA|nr:hypothetical protein LWI29_034961 [Acer saccharum]